MIRTAECKWRPRRHKQASAKVEIRQLSQHHLNQERPYIYKQLVAEPIQNEVRHEPMRQNDMAKSIPKHLLSLCTTGRTWADTGFYSIN